MKTLRKHWAENPVLGADFSRFGVTLASAPTLAIIGVQNDDGSVVGDVAIADVELSGTTQVVGTFSGGKCLSRPHANAVGDWFCAYFVMATAVTSTGNTIADVFTLIVFDAIERDTVSA